MRSRSIFKERKRTTELFCVHTAQRSQGNTSSWSSGQGATSEEVHSMYNCSNPRQNWTIILGTKKGFSWRKQKQICSGELKFDFCFYYCIFCIWKLFIENVLILCSTSLILFIVCNCFVVEDVSCLSVYSLLKLNQN